MNSSKHFSSEELSCKCGQCDGEMNEEFLNRLEILRECYGRPMTLSSAYRCPEHNANEGGADNSPHMKGVAVDVAVAGINAYDLVSCAMKKGFSGVGVFQHGDWGKRFIHIDADEGDHRPRIWDY
jgi:zinc D-Ala-D-Ala carboxypeptidase